MEDYTYHFENGNDLVLGSHMLEVCPSIAVEEKPILDVQYLGIGGKADPARLIFNTRTGPAINASLIDLGDRFRLLVNCVDAVETPHSLPKLPVANALWKAQPCDLRKPQHSQRAGVGGGGSAGGNLSGAPASGGGEGTIWSGGHAGLLAKGVWPDGT